MTRNRHLNYPLFNLRENRPTIATLATHEGLAAHTDTVARRVK